MKTESQMKLNCILPDKYASERHATRRMLLYLCMVVVAFSSVVPAFAEISYGSHVSGLISRFEISDGGGDNLLSHASGVAFDPTDTDGLYVGCAESSGTYAYKRGVYYVNLASQAYGVHLASLINDDRCSDVTVDTAGTVYYSSDFSPQIIKLEDPLGTPVVSQMMGNIAGAGDDDPFCISMVPTGFGGSYASGSDLLVFDRGLDGNANEAVYVLGAGSTADSESYSIIWQNTSTIDSGLSLAESSNYDGYLYMTKGTLPAATIAGESRYYMYRINAAGNMERIFMDADTADIVSDAVDSAIAINDADGSIWIMIAGTDDRVLYRIDAANATDHGNGDFLASVTAEITWTSPDLANACWNGMDILGNRLAIGDVGGVSSVHIYQLVPEPTTMALFALGFGFVARRKRQFRSGQKRF